MNKNNLSESQKIIEHCMNYYLKEMVKLNNTDYDDDCIKDMEDWATVEELIRGLKEGELPDKESLFFYLGDIESVELVLSYYYIARDLLKNGAIVDL